MLYFIPETAWLIIGAACGLLLSAAFWLALADFGPDTKAGQGARHRSPGLPSVLKRTKRERRHTRKSLLADRLPVPCLVDYSRGPWTSDPTRTAPIALPATSIISVPLRTLVPA